MNRAAFESRLQQLLDDRRPPSLDEELLRAADADPELKQLLAAYELLTAMRIPTPPVSAELTERVLSEWKGAATPARPAFPAWLAPLAAVAATLVLATSIAFLAQGGRDEQMVAQPAPEAPTIAQTPNDSSAPRLDRLSRQAAANYRALAVDTEASLSSALSVVQPKRPASESSAASTSAESQWLRSVPDNLRPLSNSASGAVYSLMRAVPGATDDDQEGL